MINYFNEEVELPAIKIDSVSQWIEEVIKIKGRKLGEITIIFCSDNYLLDINKTYLNHDYYTDIITFDYCSGNTISGDLFISTDTVLTNSKKFTSPYYTELHRVIIHGVLHLLGYKDKSEEEAAQMRQNENTALRLIQTNA